MATINDFESLWKTAAYAWAKSKVSDGADNVDAWHTDSIFSDYYTQYGLTLYTGSPQYTVIGTNTTTRGVYSQTYTNSASSPALGTFSYTDSVVNSFSASLTEGVTIAESDSVSLSIKGLGSASSSLTVTTNLSSTQTTTQSETQTWSVNQTIPEPPNSVETATFMVQQSTMTGSATVPLTVSGSLAIGLNSRWNGHYFWFESLGAVLQETNNVPSWLTLNADGSVSFSATYSLNGVVSNNAYITVAGPGSNMQMLVSPPAARPRIGITPPSKA